jgi:ABC-2 type transport system permease protein
MGIFTIPLVTILITVYISSGEASTGTLKELLTKPVKRENIMLSKFVAVFLYIAGITYGLLVISSLVGIRWGYPADFGILILKVIFIYLVYILGSMVLAAFTLMISALGTRPMLTTITALGFHAVSIIFIVQPFELIRKYAFSQLVFDLAKLVMGQINNFRDIYQPVAIIVIYILGFLLAASFIWEKRDITV